MPKIITFDLDTLVSNQQLTCPAAFMAIITTLFENKYLTCVTSKTMTHDDIIEILPAPCRIQIRHICGCNNYSELTDDLAKSCHTYLNTLSSDTISDKDFIFLSAKQTQDTTTFLDNAVMKIDPEIYTNYSKLRNTHTKAMAIQPTAATVIATHGVIAKAPTPTCTTVNTDAGSTKHLTSNNRFTGYGTNSASNPLTPK